jgi:Tfp pilus assembly protein PilF
LKGQLTGIRSSPLDNLPKNHKSRLIFLGILSIIFTGVVLYSNILHAPFVFDDYSSILDNETIKSLKASFRDILNNRYITEISFALNYAIGGLKPFGYHIINNFIHIINALLIYYLVILTCKTPQTANSNLPAQFIAFSSAFVFVSHPIQIQAVTYVVQRSTSMATMFYLLSLIMYIKFRMQDTGYRIQDGKSNNHASCIMHHASAPITYRFISFFYYSVSVICAILAMKTKEIAFTLPIIIVIYEFSFFNKPLNYKFRITNLKRFLYLIPIMLTILIIPLSMLNMKLPAETIIQNIDVLSRETTDITRTEYLFTQLRVIMTYLRLLVFPVNQNFDYRYPVYHSFLNIHVLLSCVFILTMIGIAIYLFYRSRIPIRGTQSPDSRFLFPNFRLISFGILWFFLTLSVESSIFPIKDVIVEHRLYLPSIGFFIGCISFIDCMINQYRLKNILIIIIVTCLSVSTYARNTLWKDPQKLWEDVINKSPSNVRAYNEIGAIFRDEGRYAEANELFKKALKINRNYAMTYYNLGYIQYKLKNYEDALVFFQEALRFKLTNQLRMDIFNSIGTTYSEMGNDRKALNAFKEAINILPTSIIPYNNLGKQYIKMGKFDLAIETLENGLKIRNEPHLRYNLSVAYAKKMGKNRNPKKIEK